MDCHVSCSLATIRGSDPCAMVYAQTEADNASRDGCITYDNCTTTTTTTITTHTRKSPVERG